ncbi:hypothetical protein Y032_0281g1257 [Ancylostoma ceylanicum]|uniref:Uncharacterized protein n=1 Tax=Ancylostoma ceylanicum TaxID=53326 RepID=A0A016S783_9BILA|nr:hypothetical protein Y032_0281g1257 [Ancylostoma ceylanicum]
MITQTELCEKKRGSPGVRDILNSSVLHFPEYRVYLGHCHRLSCPTFSDCSADYCWTGKGSALQPVFLPGFSSTFEKIKGSRIISKCKFCCTHFIF